MSKQLLIEYSLFHPIGQLHEGIKNRNGNMVVAGQVQASDKPNANKRIYPYDILELQVEKYIAGPIKENRALGELDHPECHRPSAEIMTESGWKKIKDVIVGEKVMTLNTLTSQCEWNIVERVINEPYRGKMINIRNKNIDVLVTPNHRFVTTDRQFNYSEVTAQEIFDKKISTHLGIPIDSKGYLDGISYEVFELHSHSHAKISKEKRLKFEKPLILDAKSWFGFLGFYLAEGHCGPSESSGVYISQNDGEKADKFRSLLEKLSPELEWKERKRDNSKGLVFYTYDKRLWNYLDPLGDKYSKYIPKEIKEASKDLLKEFFDWYLLGDGTTINFNGYERQSVFTVSKKLIEDLDEILVKLGGSGVIKEYITKKDYVYANHVIKAENKSTLYRLWIKKNHSISLDYRFLKAEEIDYDDTVHCVTVKNGNFYCKDNEKPFWSGNSSIINLKNVSHNILELWWQGKDLFGKIEILPTPSGNILRQLFENQISVGISSRAMGSVSSIGEGIVKVEDDLDLICWDFVSTPSTYGAYMKPMGSRGLQESYDRTIKLEDKYSRANKMISDIICNVSGICCIH